MKIIRCFWLMLFANFVFAGITYEKSTPDDKKEKVDSAAEAIKKTLGTGDLSGVNARLRVEGASFRKFNLFLPPIKTNVKPKTSEYRSALEIRRIIERDLEIVGTFSMINHDKSLGDYDHNLLKQKGAEGISSMSLTFNKGKITATLKHKNLITGKENDKPIELDVKQFRLLAHLCSQSIFEEYVGAEDIFLLQIAAIKRNASDASQVVMLDFDGANETQISDNKWLKSSPSFSPDGKSILYAVTTNDGHGIVEQNIGSKEFQFRIKRPGLNIDPRVLPDDSGLLATLTLEKTANIYLTSRHGALIRPVVNGIGENLSPSISADGLLLAFVSTRSGTPQIYVQSLAKKDLKQDNAPVRVTFHGRYNQTPHFSPDAKLIAFTGRDEKKVFDIFVIERPDHNRPGRVSRITQNQGWNQEPYFTPSGRYVIFVSKRDGKLKPDIYLASLNGDHQFRLTDANADSKSLGYFSPVVRPRLNPQNSRKALPSPLTPDPKKTM